jgi:hypothetical protein
MTLLHALDKYCSEHINEKNEWYTWSFDETHVPTPLIFSDLNLYSKNILLKNELHKTWKSESEPENKGEMIKYYISTWGGIKSNSRKSMDFYMNSSSELLIDKGKNGIASWSKALVVHQPGEYAIFDARVSTSLNCIQYISNVEDKILYPILGSRNKTIIEGQKCIAQIAKKENWERVNTKTFYTNDYLKLLNQVTKKRNTNIATVEMLLFAKAEELVFKLIERWQKENNQPSS